METRVLGCYLSWSNWRWIAIGNWRIVITGFIGNSWFKFQKTPNLVTNHWYLFIGPVQIWSCDNRPMPKEAVAEIEQGFKEFWEARELRGSGGTGRRAGLKNRCPW